MSGGEKGRNSRAWGELQDTLGLLKKWLKYCWFFSAALSSAAKQSDSVIHIQIYIYIFHIVFHCNLSQDIAYSSHCYTVILCCLSILYISFYLIIPNSQSSFPIPTCLMATTCLGFLLFAVPHFLRCWENHLILTKGGKWNQEVCRVWISIGVAGSGPGWLMCVSVSPEFSECLY